MVKDIKSGKVQGLNKDKVRASFIFASCFTCHSAQGSSIDGDIAIFDYNHFLIRKVLRSGYGRLLQEREM